MEIKNYRDLIVWQKSVDLVIDCYAITRRYPDNEKFGLSSQIQRAAVSISANIAEGHSRQHTKEYLQHLSIAYGSLAELETLLHISNRLDYISTSKMKPFSKQTSEIGRMLNGLRSALKPDP
ncbi:MAG: four helix bundle protein [Candidatus Neomarinimicrobiota bacterium]